MGIDFRKQPGQWNRLLERRLPPSLGGTSVTINGKAAFLIYVSPRQINLQAPDDTAIGTVSVVVTTAVGSATSTVTLSQFAPSFDLLDPVHVAGIILRSNGSGAYGGGTYDILGPTGSSLGYPTVAAQPGDTVELFGVGFGPTTPAVPAGNAFSGSAPINNPLSLYINNIFVKPTFVGLSSAGLYQINLTVPSGIGEGDVPIRAIVGGKETQMGALFPLQSASAGSTYPVTGGGGTNPGTFFSPRAEAAQRVEAAQWAAVREVRAAVREADREADRLDHNPEGSNTSPDFDFSWTLLTRAVR